jgi:arginase
MDSHPSRFDIIALTGWAADRNDLAMRGARALGRRFTETTGAHLREVGELGPAQHLPWPEALERARPHLRGAARAISDAVERGQPALVFANRCAAGIATIAAGLASRPDLAVLYLDAQADFNTPQTTMSGYLGGMVISALCGLWETGFGAGLDPSRLVLAGSRDIDPGERELLARHDVQVHEVGNPGPIVERLRGRSIWIHVDLDVLEPGLVPTEYRVPGGPGLDQVRQLLDAVARTSPVVALEIAEYELDPEQADLHAARIEHLVEPVLQRWRSGTNDL